MLLVEASDEHGSCVTVLEADDVAETVCGGVGEDDDRVLTNVQTKRGVHFRSVNKRVASVHGLHLRSLEVRIHVVRAHWRIQIT